MSPVNDFFRSRIDQMIDLRLPLAVLASRMPWQEIEASLAHNFARKVKAGKPVDDIGLFGPTVIGCCFYAAINLVMKQKEVFL